MGSSQIKYFQNKNSPIRQQLEESRKKESRVKKSSYENSEIKKLLENLITSKSKYEEKKRR
jgi:hypothetical protein